MTMFANYLKIAFRNLWKYKVHSFINVAGLAIGMACCIVILLFVQDELSYDRFHEHANRIYRIVVKLRYENQSDNFAHTQAPLAPALLQEFPEVVDAVRLTSYRELVSHGQKQFWENSFMLADPSIFNLFTFPLLKGDPKTAINDLYTVVITERAAKKYFGDEEPVGKILRIGVDDPRDFQITGVLKDIPFNSQLQFGLLASFAHQKGNIGWGQWNYSTYILLPENYPASELERKLPDFVGKYMGEETRSGSVLQLQPLTRIHLFSKLRSDLTTNRYVTDIYILSGIALLILMLACINFMNLATARSTLREKEVGVRKVVGASHWQLIRQFLSESLVLSFLALFAAIFLVELFLPVFNALADKQLRLSLLQNSTLLWGSLIITFVVGILAGSYPAFVISAFQPLQVIRGVLLSSLGGRPSFLRKALVVTQFAVAILFISSLMVIHQQLLYIRNKNLGYQRENVVVLPIFYKDIQPKYELFKKEILSNVNVVSATITSYSPNTEGYNQTAWWEGMPDDDYSQRIRWVSVDEDFIKTLGLKIVTGRDFSKELHDELQGAYVLNESAVKAVGWQNPIGKLFKVVKKGPVIGVVKDFHFRSLHNTIEPVALHIDPEAFFYLFIRTQPDQLSGTIKFLQEKWRQIFPDRPFDYSFLNDDLEQVYKSEARLGKIFNYIGGLSILIACLGLLGLASFMAERKTKEIGIRKVLGASAVSIFSLLSKNFVMLVLLANLLAWPIAWYAMKHWLENFAYRIDLGWWVFALAGGLALLIALLTVSTQAIKAALANPVEALRYE
jgi:ABC-type antimicrobial peptide transport system permease subunit